MISIIPIMDTNIENRKMVAAIAYPAALEPFLAVDTTFVDVVARSSQCIKIAVRITTRDRPVGK